MKFINIKSNSDKNKILNRIIRDKFKEEHISMENAQFVAKKFVESVNKLIDMIASNVIDIDEYITITFGE